MASNVKSHRGIRNKGAVGEREIKDRFIAAMAWIEAQFVIEGEPQSEKVKRNSTQSDRGGHDLIGIPGLCIEVKRQEALSVGSWWEQAVTQATRFGGLPVLIYRQNKRAWRVRTWGALHLDGASAWAVVECELEEFMRFYGSVYFEWLLKKGLTRR
jgi:Holliday junction resolvase